MKAFDFVATILIGLFLVMVVVNGNTAKMFALAKRDSGFLKWGAAAAFLFYLRDLPEARGPVNLLIIGAFLALFMRHYKTIVQSGQEILSTF